MERKQVSKGKRSAEIGRRFLAGVALLGVSGMVALGCGGESGNVGSSVAAGTTGGVCMVDRYNATKPADVDNLRCTSNDVQLAQYTVIEGPTECFEGEDVTLVLQGQFVSTADQRWDVGVFVSEDGRIVAPDGGSGGPNERGGACYSDFLNPVSPNNNDLDLTGGAGPFYNGEIEEDPSDMCGDIQKSTTNPMVNNDAFYNTMEITIVCQDVTGPEGDPDGTADVGTCTVWANSRSDGTDNKPSCIDEGDVSAETTAKCTCANVPIAGLTVRKTATIEVIKKLPLRYMTDSFDLQIDGVTEADNAIDDGTTGPTTVSAGTSTMPGVNHFVGEVAGTGTGGTSEDTVLANYVTSIECVYRNTMNVVASCTDCITTEEFLVGPDDDIVCTITNELILPKLTLVKVVENGMNPGGTAVANDWTLTATGPFPNTSSTFSGMTGVMSDVFPGTYDLSETGPAGYLASDWDCIGGNQTDGDTIQLAPTEEATCTITNTAQGMTTLLKLTQGVESDMMWNFTLNGPGGVDESDSSPPTTVDFGGVKLIPGGEYTLCETGIPAGWTLEWQVDTDGDGVPDTIIPMVANVDDDPVGPDGYSRVYDPNYVAPPGTFTNDTRCVNFVVGVGETLAFQIDNRFPGGEPRTIGYWKNWNTCTNGNQPQTAANNGGPAEGWFILDDLLNNPGYTIGILTLDGEDCEAAVDILDKRSIDDGRKRASDAAYNLAAQLLAAQLNLSAGAETCMAVVMAVNAAQDLLAGIGFDGTGAYLKGKQGADANDLAAKLDQYNNGFLCN